MSKAREIADLGDTLSVDPSAPSGSISIDSNGNLDLTGKGIVFGTVSGDVTSKTLDDYEEGTWTPNITSEGGGTTTGSTFLGRYTKVGNLVTIQWACTNFTGSGGSGDLMIQGLPFAPQESLASRPIRGGNVVFYNYNLPDAGYGYVVPEAINNSSIALKFRVPVDNGNWDTVQYENAGTLYCEGSITYWTA